MTLEHIEENVEVIEAISLESPSQEVVEECFKEIEAARKKAIIEKQITDRMLTIVGKIDVIYRECYKIDNTHMLYYSYEWSSDKLISFAVQSKVLNTASRIPGSLPLSVVWDDKELHIALEMMKSDIYDERKELKKIIEALPLPKKTFWDTVKRWLSF